MDIKSQQECNSCIYNDCERKSIVEFYWFECQQQGKLILEDSEIIFVLDGALTFTYKDYPPQTVQGGSFFFLTSGGEVSYDVSCKSHILVIHLKNKTTLCEGFKFEHLKKTDTDRIDSTIINTLEINSSLWSFLNVLKECISTDSLCSYYYEIKVKEFFLLLKAFYSEIDLYRFFSQIVTSDIAFSDKVRKNYYKYKTIKELADSMCMSQKNFAKKFVAVFGEAPAQWMRKEKARLIYAEIFACEKTLSQIADDYGFSHLPSFNRFCKRELGKNPGEIRCGNKC